MGKNHRHKKRLKAEKSKTQLKSAAKELLKRQNITNPEFKIKPIVLQPQLQTKVTEDGKKDLSLDDVLNRLNHRNENRKIHACQDMECLLKNKEVENIEFYFKNVCSFIQEDMPKARRAGLKLLQTMLSMLNEEEVGDTHFEFLRNHLRCAMTTINKRIREDSVLFFDLLLKYLPNLMARHFFHFISDFMMLISSLKNDAELRRTVTVNLESKLTSSQWRIAVLGRLHQVLELLLKRKLAEIGIKKKMDTLEQPFYKIEQWYGKELSSLDRLECLEIEDDENIELQFTNIFVILYETWLEGGPVQASSEITLLSEETAMLLNCIVQTFHILTSYLRGTKRMDKIKTLEHEKLLRNLVQNLPYGLIKVPKKSNQISGLLSKFVIVDIKCTNDNILICHDYLQLFASNPSKAKAEDISKIVDTITDYLTRNYANNKKMDFTKLFEILRHLLIEKARLWCRNKFPVKKILEGAITLHNTGNLEHAVKIKLTELLCSVSYEELLENKSFSIWLESLPKVLLEENVDPKMLVLIINRTRLFPYDKNMPIIKGILDNYIKIYNHLPNMKIHGMTELDVKMRKIQVSKFISYIPSPELKNILIKLDKTSPYWKEVAHLQTERDDGPNPKRKKK